MTATLSSPTWGGDPFASASPWTDTPPDVPVAGPSSQADWGTGSDDEDLNIASRSLPLESRDTLPESGEIAHEENDEDDFGDFDEGGAPFSDEPESFATSEETFGIHPGSRAEELAPLIARLFERIFPMASASLSGDNERLVGGDAQTLVSEDSRALFSLLSQPMPVRPVDWKRSRVRREHLVALGVPVNMDEFATPEMPILPPLITSVPAGTRGPSSAPATSSHKSNARSSPSAARNAQPSTPLDRARAAELLALTEEQLSLTPLPKLETMRRELQNLAADASAALTKSLERREALISTGEAYDNKIQELVAAAQRLKPGPSSASVKRSSSGSSRWTRSPGRPASPALGGSGRR